MGVSSHLSFPGGRKLICLKHVLEDVEEDYIIFYIRDKTQIGNDTFLYKVHPGRLTWNLQIAHLERKMIFQTSMTMFYVNLQGCNLFFGNGSWNLGGKISYKIPMGLVLFTYR